MSRFILFLMLIFSSLCANAATVFYLHGKIVEDQGDNAIHPQYGIYEYERILVKLREAGHTVYSERRRPDTDRMAYSKKVVSKIRALLERGVAADEIVVIGFSKGAQIAILVSESLANSDIRFVLQAVCGSWVTHFENLKVYGDILSMYETSDSAGSCVDLFGRSKPSTCEIPISTGLLHGAFYRPIDAWLKPQEQWISRRTCISSMTSND